MTIISEQATTERRGERRQRVLKSGLLTFNRGFGAMECTVRNESEHGARLSFGETSAVPPAFSIRIGDRGMPRPAQVRWRTMTEVGISLD